MGTWSDSSALLITDTSRAAIYRIMQSGLSAWWLVMARCAGAGLDAQMARAWLDRAEGTHYADALIDATLGVEIGPFEFQAPSLPEAFDTDPKVYPVACMTRDPDSASAHAERMIRSVSDDLNGRPRTPEPAPVMH